MAAVQLQARFVIRIIQIKWGAARNEEQCRIFDGPFGFGMEDFHGVFPFVELVFEEILVFFRLDVRFIARPQRLHGIEGPRFDLFFFRCIFDSLAIGIFWFFLGYVIHGNRITDVIGILLHQTGNRHLIGIIFFTLVAVEILAQMEDDGRTVFRFFTFFQAVRTITGRFPFIGLFFTSLAGNDRHRISYHEGRIKADTELADEVFVRRIAVLGFLQFFQKGFRPRFGNGPQILHQVFFIHAQAIIGNSQRVGIGIGCQVDFKSRIPFQDVAVGQRFIMKLIDCIGCVGYEFTQENFMIRIDRMNHQVQ